MSKLPKALSPGEEARVRFEVPLIPPSVNHYKTRFRNGNTVVSNEALAFKAAVAIYAKGQFIQGKRFRVNIQITLGKGERGDVDNFPKLVLDGLADAGVFHDLKGKRVSDGRVRQMAVLVDEMTRPETGYTFIEVEVL